MSQITDIKPQKSSRGGSPRFNIYVDGKFAFALPAEALAKAGLKINQEISEKEIQKLVKENEFLKVYDWALKFFSYRPRSEKELRDWFKRKQVGEETQAMILKKMKQLGYLNDEEFARWWIEQRTTFRPSGVRLLAMELRQKGISKEIVSHVTSHMSQVSEHELAKKVAEKKLKSLKNLPKKELREKLSMALARRGFSWEIIKEVISKSLTSGGKSGINRSQDKEDS